MAAFSRAAGREPRPATHAFRFVISRFLHCSPADKSPDWTIASRQKFSWTISSSPLSSLACSAADSRRQQHPMVASSPQFQVQVGACICLSDFISLFYHQYAAGALVGPPFELLLTVCGSATPTPRFAAGAVCAEPDARQALIKQQVTSRSRGAALRAQTQPAAANLGAGSTTAGATHGSATPLLRTRASIMQVGGPHCGTSELWACGAATCSGLDLGLARRCGTHKG